MSPSIILRTPRQPAPPGVRLLSAVLLGIGALVLAHSLAWRHARFPGFFLGPNRVVPSAGLPSWSDATEGRPVFQAVLLAVDEQPVASAREAYERVATHRVGEPVTYLFAQHGALERRTLPVRTLSDGEYASVFGMYLFTSLAYLVLAVLAGERWRCAPVYQGLTVLGWTSAAFGLTGTDLYGPGSFFRLYALVEALLPAAAAHLALTCPRDAALLRRGTLPLLYGLAGALGVLQEVFLYDPAAAAVIHNVCQGLTGLPLLTLAARLTLALHTPSPEMHPRRMKLLLAGTFAGIVVPAVLLGVSGLAGGVLSVTATGWLSFLFPVACVASFKLTGSGAAGQRSDETSGLPPDNWSARAEPTGA